MTIHYGNGNHKRKFAKCGAPESYNDSVSSEKVDCIKCIKLFLKTTTMTGHRKEKWTNRLDEIIRIKNLPWPGGQSDNRFRDK